MRGDRTALKITGAEYEGGHTLRLSFSNGKIQRVDLGPFLRSSFHPGIRKYLKPRNFRHFRIKNGELMWGDFELVFPIMDLYRNTIGERK